MSWFGFGGRKKLLAGMFLLAMVVSNASMALRVLPMLRRGYQDFTIFYGAGTMVRTGQSASLYDLNAQFQTQRTFAPDVPIRQAALPYNHPPFEALFFAPLTFLGYLPAYGLWTVLNVTMVVTSIVLLRKHFAGIRELSPGLLGLAAAGFYPIAIGIIQGQDASLLLLITVLATLAASDGKDVAAGAILALGLFKFHLIGPLALVVAARRPKLLVGFLPVALALAGISVALVGWSGIVDYVRFILRLDHNGAGGAISAFGMPNLRGLLADIVGSRAVSVGRTLLVVAGSIAVLGTAMWKVNDPGKTTQHGFALGTVAAILVSYHTMPYDLTLLFPVALFLFAATCQSSSREYPAEIVGLLIMFLTPLYVFLDLRVSRLGWFALLLGWLFWRLCRAATAKSVPLKPAAFAQTL